MTAFRESLLAQLITTSAVETPASFNTSLS